MCCFYVFFRLYKHVEALTERNEKIWWLFTFKTLVEISYLGVGNSQPQIALCEIKCVCVFHTLHITNYLSWKLWHMHWRIQMVEWVARDARPPSV